jgi:hypothetical protein
MPRCYEREQRLCIDAGFFDEQDGFVAGHKSYGAVWTKELLKDWVFVLLTSVGKLVNQGHPE